MYYRHGHTRTWEASRGIVSAEQMRTTAPLSPSSPSHASFLLPLLFLVHVCRQKKKMVPASKALKGALVAALASASLGLAAPVDPTTPVAPLEATTAIAPGECMSYQSGDANAVLCVQEAKLTAPNNLLLAGFLFNNGTVELCDVKLAPLNAPGVTAFWPDWASDASYEKYFNLKQMTSVGLTATPNADGSLPSVEIVSLRACDPTKDAAVPVAAEGGVEVPAEGGVEVPMEDGVATVFPLETRKIALEDSPMMPPVKKEVLGEEPTGAGPEIVPNARRLASDKRGGRGASAGGRLWHLSERHREPDLVLGKRPGSHPKHGHLPRFPLQQRHGPCLRRPPSPGQCPRTDPAVARLVAYLGL
ncbi:hypothetical protein Naga_101147g1 [Nannochloropsis gaditana]|uniref:Uncharacterized protein n=1 Tax=Nannochloropsis gaditana TaxID=72520 RepID=W7T7D7_9STRA|nr:hypothetical protein Naga_101147g1 [Nannochloropsis gaditana]